MKHTRTAVILFILQVGYLLFCAAWFDVAIKSGNMLDEPGARDHFGILMLFVVIWIYPLVVGLFSLLGWLTYHKHSFRVSLWLTGVPLLWVLPLAGAYVFGFK
ncbi:hypothetical protein ACFOQM_04875 [Paenibacillus sp. GCM10012307]|uniref:Uncharacterized protein n=1 Tax=Paenibacillus roseus TaxID=2798579 RepID=A0A934MU20_9BACL|nr:hypothetical protein [Paenibacillus roseus]MBJ6360642.1 hypothetical protein [Paenibacillus roseus]